MKGRLVWGWKEPGLDLAGARLQAACVVFMPPVCWVDDMKVHPSTTSRDHSTCLQLGQAVWAQSSNPTQAQPIRFWPWARSQHRVKAIVAPLALLSHFFALASPKTPPNRRHPGSPSSRTNRPFAVAIVHSPLRVVIVIRGSAKQSLLVHSLGDALVPVPVPVPPLLQLTVAARAPSSSNPKPPQTHRRETETSLLSPISKFRLAPLLRATPSRHGRPDARHPVDSGCAEYVAETFPPLSRGLTKLTTPCSHQAPPNEALPRHPHRVSQAALPDTRLPRARQLLRRPTPADPLLSNTLPPTALLPAMACPSPPAVAAST